MSEEINTPAEEQTPSFTEQDFFTYANEHYGEQIGKEVTSIDDFMSVKEIEKEVVKEIPTVPEYLKGYDDFYKETNGRGMDDYIASQKDWESVDDDAKVAEYIRRKQPYLDSDEVAFKVNELKQNMQPLDDDDLDTTAANRRIKNATIEWKSLVHDSTTALQSEREKYKSPLPDVNKQISEGMEIFKNEFTQKVNSTESVKFGDLEYKFSKDDLKDVQTLEDINKLVVGDGGDYDSALKAALFLKKGDQIIKDAVETAIVNHENERLKQKNNATDAPLGNVEKTNNSILDALAKLKR